MISASVFQTPAQPQNPTRPRIVSSFGVLMAALLLAACAGGTGPPASPLPGGGGGGGAYSGGGYKIGNPYRVAGKWYTPREDPDYDRVGVASWYGPKFHGRRTANGETFDMNAFSAAHTTLPLPSYVRVTNLANGRSIVVRVNDRGPFVGGRIIDLSRHAAKELGFLKTGTARVRVEAVRNPIGERFVLAKATTTQTERDFVVAAPAVGVQSQPLAPPPGVSVSPPLEKPLLVASRARGLTPVKVSALNEQTRFPARLYVQAGAFSDLTNAHRLRDQLDGLGPVDVAPVTIGGTRYYRVRIGPLESLDLADNTLSRVINGGHADARIVVDDIGVDGDVEACRFC